MTIEIVEIPIENADLNHSYVKVPEGKLIRWPSPETQCFAKMISLWPGVVQADPKRCPPPWSSCTIHVTHGFRKVWISEYLNRNHAPGYSRPVLGSSQVSHVSSCAFRHHSFASLLTFALGSRLHSVTRHRDSPSGRPLGQSLRWAPATVETQLQEE